MATKRERAFTYLRVSGRGQVDGDGFDRQRQTVTDYAAANRIDLVAEFRDEGVSGTKELDHRPGLSDLFEAIAADGVRLVLVERADRLARDLVVGELLLREFSRHGVRVVEAAGGTDLTDADDDDPTRRLIRQVLGAVSEFEKSVIVAKLRGARERYRAREGRCEGRKPYGTRPNEREAAARLFELARKPRGKPRRSLQTIADTMNAEGHPTRSGKPWSRYTVRGILERGRGHLDEALDAEAARRDRLQRTGRG